ncbi:MAG: hypothetical protein ABIR79_12640 [Candidatus Binatia bacterium]
MTRGQRWVFFGAVLLVLLVALPVGAQSTRIAPPGGLPKSGTKSCATSAAALVASATPVLSVALRNSSSTISVVLGNSTAQDFTLLPGASISFDIADLAKIYCKTTSSTATLEYFAVQGP